MFRFLAVVLVIGAFGAALYFSGDTLEAWESPKPEPVAIPKLPKPKKHARPARHVQPAKRNVPAKPGWLVELNAACRRGKRERRPNSSPTSAVHPSGARSCPQEGDRAERAHEP